MSNVYLTLVSDVTSDFVSNVANKFKVKPRLRLPREGWKVFIVSAMLPKMALFKDWHDKKFNLMEVFGKSEKNGQPDAWKKGIFKASDLREWEQAGTCSTGEEFFNAVKQRLEETGHADLDDGFKFSSGHWVHLAWDKTGAQPELVIANTTNQNLCYIYMPFAKTLRWINQSSGGDVFIGKNLVPNFTKHTKGTTSLSNGKVTEVFRQYITFRTLTDWRFINLNQSFKDALNLHARPLTVTANNDNFAQSLGHVYYAPQGRERHAFTPLVEEFHHVHTNQWDEVEISLKELDDSLVKFQSDSQCVIRLHFKQD